MPIHPTASGADEDLAAAVGNQAPAAGGIVSIRGSGGSGSAKASHGTDGKKGGKMLYAKQQDGSKKRASFGSSGGKGKKKQKN